MCISELKESLIEIGRILKPFGVKGELKLALYIDDASDLKKVHSFYIKDKTEVSGFRELAFDSLKFEENPEYAKIKFSEITDRTQAEEWRLVPIYIKKELINEPNEGEYFIKDLLSSEAWYKESKIGVIFNIFEVANQEMFVIKGENTKTDLVVPFNDKYVSSISLEEKKIVFDHIDELL